ncbi:MAG: molybdopterin-synthase adenylyltransferase MoeB [Thermoplasmata archaeon]
MSPPASEEPPRAPGVRWRIPQPLRPYTGGSAEVAVAARDVGEAMRALLERHPALRPHLVGPDGALRRSVRVFRNNEDIRGLDSETTAVGPGDTLAIVPAIAGGNSPPSRNGPLDRDAMVRFSRHLLLPEIGLAGQRRLLASRVLLVGAGGLGSPAALYLAAAGVGTIGIVDFDRVDRSNLQRQILFGEREIGEPKVDAAARRIRDLNPQARVIAHPERLDRENALTILGGYDLVVDGSDNFPTRYLVNDACIRLGIPDVFGSIYRFEGQVSVFGLGDGPCYRCLYPEPPPPELVPSCAEAGVLGVLPGVIGTLQATEAVKVLLNVGEPLAGRLLLYDALAMAFREVAIRRDPHCPRCTPEGRTGPLPAPAALPCASGGDPLPGSADPVPTITVEELAEALRGPDPPFLLDVREPDEWEICHLPGAHLIPAAELPDRLAELAPARELVVYCRSGGRSAAATRLLKELGYVRVRNLEGGILSWARAIDPAMPTSPEGPGRPAR